MLPASEKLYKAFCPSVIGMHDAHRHHRKFQLCVHDNWEVWLQATMSLLIQKQRWRDLQNKKGLVMPVRASPGRVANTDLLSSMLSSSLSVCAFCELTMRVWYCMPVCFTFLHCTPVFLSADYVGYVYLQAGFVHPSTFCVKTRQFIKIFALKGHT